MKIARPAALKFIFITILVDVIGWGLIIPIMPKLIGELKHISPGETSKYGGWLVTVYALMQFTMAPLLGALSDKYGRRPVLLFSLFGFGVDYLFMAYAPTYEWLFVGRVISGITGASFTTASAYIADISDADNRAKNWNDWRGLWSWLYYWSRYWRHVGWPGITCAILCSSRFVFIELVIWLFYFTRVVR
jgi:DHA1 family tetracycline resistance protein-like MFS transporter